jgi:tripartite-type tricarboxylate transporter receptor subunit TctC
MARRSYCRHALAWLCALAPFLPAAAHADDAYPTRPIHIVIPFPAARPSDIAARIIAQKMNEDWGQPVIVDNRPGANTIIGAETVAKGAPDGYTLLMAIDSTLVMNQYLYKTLPYDPLNDFAPITTTVKSMSLLCVPAETGPKSVPELIARAKAAPGKLNYGAGTITVQLAGLLFNKAAGIDTVYVPFKGTAETVQGLLTRLGRHGLCRDRGGRPADRKRQAARARKTRRPQRALPRRADAGRGGGPAEF